MKTKLAILRTLVAAFVLFEFSEIAHAQPSFDALSFGSGFNIVGSNLSQLDGHLFLLLTCVLWQLAVFLSCWHFHTFMLGVKRRRGVNALLKCSVFCCLLFCLSAQGQGTFRNLDFELGQIPQNQPAGFVSADLAFPFWTIYNGTIQQTQVLWNDVSLFPAQASLLGANGVPPFGSPRALDGGYSAILVGGATGCSLSQIAQIPTDAASILFKAGVVDASQPPEVTIGGVSLPLFAVSSGPNYTLFGADVSQFAGMQGGLRFIAAQSYNFGLDDIVFSTTPVPEPSAASLLWFGAVITFWRNRHHLD